MLDVPYNDSTCSLHRKCQGESSRRRRVASQLWIGTQRAKLDPSSVPPLVRPPLVEASLEYMEVSLGALQGFRLQGTGTPISQCMPFGAVLRFPFLSRFEHLEDQQRYLHLLHPKSFVSL